MRRINEVDAETVLGVESSLEDSFKKSGRKESSWGRAHARLNFWSKFSTTFLFLFAPLIVYFYYISCKSYGCSLTATAWDLITLRRSPIEFVQNEFPMPTWEAAKIFAIWEIFQAMLFVFVPGPIGYGQQTPAGMRLQYNVNGLRAWIITHIVWFSCVYLGIFPATIVYDNWGALLSVANIFGFLLATFCYFKALIFPTHPGDLKWSNYFLYDFFMGAEFNPRIGNFDFKLFFNGRPGIIGWNVINLSYLAAQSRIHGHVTNSMVLVIALHLLYILDFFYYEDWYLRTIDIAHDHFGWLLAWGDSVWLPFMYTLQGFYLTFVPHELTNVEFAIVLGAGLAGYYIFRATNNQKNDVRNHNGKIDIWGKPAKFLVAEYTTTDGVKHKSLLLYSGFWGFARHFNYLGDLMISFAYCAACGFEHFYPYFYFLSMVVLLVARVTRDHARCHAKYGKTWEEYCKIVPYRIIPYVW